MSAEVKLIFRLVQDEDDYPPASVESVWAQPTANVGEYAIDNIPFFARDATLADTVRASERDGELWFEELIQPSGNSLIRVMLIDLTCFERVHGRLVSLGCSTEYSQTYDMLAVSIPPEVPLTHVQAYLTEEATAEAIAYEEPLLRQ